MIGIGARRERVVRIGKTCQWIQSRKGEKPQKLFSWSMGYRWTGCFEKWDWENCCCWLCSHAFWEMICYFSSTRDFEDNFLVWNQKLEGVHLEFTDWLSGPASSLQRWKWYFVLITNRVLDLGDGRKTDSSYWLCDLLALWTWMNYLTFLSFIFHICKTAMKGLWEWGKQCTQCLA